MLDQEYLYFEFSHDVVYLLELLSQRSNKSQNKNTFCKSLLLLFFCLFQEENHILVWCI